MKIGVNSRIFQERTSGIPAYIKNLYYEVIKLDSYNEYTFFQSNENKKIGYTKIIKTFPNLFGAVFFDLFLITNLIKSQNIKIFHAPAHILPYFKVRGVKYAVTIHDLAFIFLPEQYSFLFRTYYNLMLKRAVKNADIIITVSKSTKDDVCKIYKLDSRKVKVVYPGIPTEKIQNKANSKNLLGEKYFLSVTTHPYRKNIYSILKILSTSKEEIGIKYVIVGELSTGEYSKIKKLINFLNIQDYVYLFGYASDEEIINLYRNAEFLIYPSYYEGFGFPVLEAIVNNCLVITSNNSSLKELLPSPEWLIDPYNLEEIKNSILKLLSMPLDERNKHKLQNTQHAMQFSWLKAAKEIVNINTELYKIRDD